MPTTRGQVWFFTAMLLFVALMQFARAHDYLGPNLQLGDWAILTILLLAPPVLLWRYFRRATETTPEMLQFGMQLVLVGYMPLWFGFMMVMRVVG